MPTYSGYYYAESAYTDSSMVKPVPVYVDDVHVCDVAASTIFDKSIAATSTQEYKSTKSGKVNFYSAPFDDEMKVRVGLGTTNDRFGLYSINLPEGKSYTFLGAKPIKTREQIEIALGPGTSSKDPESKTIDIDFTRFGLYFSSSILDNKIDYFDYDTGSLIYSKSGSNEILVTSADKLKQPFLKNYDTNNYYRDQTSDTIFNDITVTKYTQVYLKCYMSDVYYYTNSSYSPKFYAHLGYGEAVQPTDSMKLYKSKDAYDSYPNITISLGSAIGNYSNKVTLDKKLESLLL